MGCNSFLRLNLYLLTLGTEIGNYHRVNDDGIYFMAFVCLTAVASYLWVVWYKNLRLALNS